MTAKELGSQSAYARPFGYKPDPTNPQYSSPQLGMSIRQAFAMAAMQGIKSNTDLLRICSDVPGMKQQQAVAKMAVQDADALLEELAKGVA